MKLIDAPTAPWGNVGDWQAVEGHPNTRIARSARVYGSAEVSESARVYGSAWVSGDGDIANTGDYLVLQCVGSKIGSLTMHRDRKIGVRLNSGCFSGSLDEFMSRLTDDPAHEFYRRIVPLAHAELLRRMTPLDNAANPGQAGEGETV